MKNLEDRLNEAMVTRCYGPDADYKRGYIEALKFTLRKHKENWSIKDFEVDLKDTEKNLENFEGEYKEGILSALKFNIKIMEEKEHGKQTRTSTN